MAYAFRVYAVARQSLWPDEIYSFAVSRWSLAEVWSKLVHDHVPLYTTLLGVWEVFAGSSALGLRYFSVLASVAMVSIFVILGRRLFPPVPRYTALILIAISPFQVYFAQEVVTYALLGLLSALVTWLFLSRPADPDRTSLLLAGVAYASLLYAHYAGFFVLATHGAIAILSWVVPRPAFGRDPWSSEASRLSPRWGIAWGLGLVLFAPWMVGHFGYVGENLVGGTTRPIGTIASILAIDLSFGPVLTGHLDAGKAADARILTNLQRASWLVPIGLFLAILPRRRAHWSLPWNQLVAVAHSLVPFGILLLLVLFSRDFASRYGFPAVAWVSIAVVLGLWRLPIPIRWIGVGALVSFSLWGDVIYFEHPGFARLDFRSAVDHIVERRQPGDAVIVTAPYVESTFAYYADSVTHLRPDLPTEALPNSIPPDPARTREALRLLASSSRRIWLLRWQDYYSDPRGLIAGWLNQHGYPVASQHLPGGIAVDLFLTREPVLDRLPASAIPASGVIESVHLVGFERMAPEAPDPRVTLYWRIDARLDQDYTTFVQLLGPTGERIAQDDGTPYNGRFPTTSWPVNSIIPDPRILSVSPCVPPGHYQLALGFYTLKTMRRLGSPGHDTIRIPVEIDPPRFSAPGAILPRLPAALRLDDLLPNPPPHCRT